MSLTYLGLTICVKNVVKFSILEFRVIDIIGRDTRNSFWTKNGRNCQI